MLLPDCEAYLDTDSGLPEGFGGALEDAAGPGGICVPVFRLRGSNLGSVMVALVRDANRRCCSSLLGLLA